MQRLWYRSDAAATGSAAPAVVCRALAEHPKPHIPGSLPDTPEEPPVPVNDPDPVDTPDERPRDD